MAEALARHLAPDAIVASSAGLSALGFVAAPTLAVLAENEVPCDGLLSKPLGGVDLSAIDLVVNLSGRSIDKFFDGRRLQVEDWDVGDPFGSDLAVYRRIHDEIERRILDLAERLRAADANAGISTGKS
jgi:protein-tyrosine-phosphatase